MNFYNPVDLPPTLDYERRIRAIAALVWQHFRAPSSIALEPR